ncbi:MAG: YdbH domain-containing protein [Hyphomonadaceae bacterium]|nr:YdbH domain-containing protein [Hyphomonadaceae bacterium]
MRPRLTRARLVLGAAGIALVTLAGAAWIFRLPLADAAARDAFRKAGIDADFDLTQLDAGGAGLRNLRLGPANAPDAVAAQANARLAWSMAGPRLAGLSLESPALRVRVDAKGVSLGQLDRLLGGGGDGGRPLSRLPDLTVDIANGRALLLTPAGAIPATFSAQGRLTRDFAARAEIAPVSVRSGDAEIGDLRALATARTEAGALLVDLDAALAALRWPGAGGDGVAGQALRLTGRASVPADLARAEAGLTASGASLSVAGAAVRTAALDARLEPARAGVWRTRVGLTFDRATAPGATVGPLTAAVSAEGDLRQAFGEWSVRSADNRLGDLFSPEASAAGAYTFDGRAADGAVIAATGRLSLPDARLSAEGRARLVGAIPAMAGSPVAPQVAAGKAAVDRALARFATAAALQLDWRKGAGRIAAPGPLSLDAASGARITVSPRDAGRPVLLALAPSGAVESSALIEVAGGDMPPAQLSLDRFSLQAGALAAEGALTIADWRAAGGRIDLQRTRFTFSRNGAAGALALDGALAVDGGTEALSVANFRAPLRIDARWGGGFRVALPDGCIPAQIDGLGIPGHRFGAQAVSLCAGPDRTLVAADAAGRLSGGFATGRIALAGRTADAAGRPATLAVDAIVGRFTGPAGDSHLALEARAPRYAVDFAPDRRIRFAGDVVTARTAPGGQVAGTFRGGVLEDPALPAYVTAIDARWNARPEAGRTVVRIADGVARVTDKFFIEAQGSAAEAAAEGEPLPRFNPLRVTQIAGALADGRIEAGGAILLESGKRRLAGFTAVHDLQTGTGEAHVTNPALQFSRDLDLYEITELARGVVDGVSGPVGVDVVVSWDKDTLSSRGRISPRNVNLNAAALGPVDGVSGDVDFADLFALTSRPGQKLTVRRLNPGIVVESGEITFQILNPEQILIEGAVWPFAAGRLSVERQLVLLGDENFRMNLTLSDVDVQQLLDQLGLKDLSATGRVEGSFPLEFTRDGGKIVKGVLRATSGGGEIRYTGNAGDGLVGAPQIAFDALKSFAYDDLSLELDGDLDGEIVSAIRFSGENQQPIGGIVAPGVLPLPGMDRLKVTGWPFKFTVSVRAPFRQLARSSDSINDARPLVDQAILEDKAQDPQTPPTGVDPPQPAPR